MNVRQWTEGVCGDGAVIICDGEPVTISDVLARLNHAEHVEAERDALRARIDDAPKAYAYGGSSGDPMIACPDHLRHSTIALVEVND